MPTYYQVLVYEQAQATSPMETKEDCAAVVESLTGFAPAPEDIDHSSSFLHEDKLFLVNVWEEGEHA